MSLSPEARVIESPSVIQSTNEYVAMTPYMMETNPYSTKMEMIAQADQTPKIAIPEPTLTMYYPPFRAIVR